MTFQFEPIAVVESCFSEKFGTPRQPTLAPSASGIITMLPPYHCQEAFEGLEGCSHIWVQFVFHLTSDTDFTPKVRPPRLGGNKSMGVFATRSPNRPNRIGLSVLKLDRIESTAQGVRLFVSGVDLVSGTPVLDIKPYLPYVDKIDDAQNAFAPSQPELVAVVFSDVAESKAQALGADLKINFMALITEVLAQDPRPSFHAQSDDRVYKMSLAGHTLSWRVVTANGQLQNYVDDITRI